MMRHVLALAVVACVTPVAEAQTTVLTITVARADVRKAPTIVSPIVGQAPLGRELEVTRDVGDWMKVSWPEAPDGVGYVRRAEGSLSRGMPPPTNRAVDAAPAQAAAAPDPPDVTAVRADIGAVERRIQSRTQETQYVRPPTQTLGLGALVSGSTIAFGGSGRAWSRAGLGAQLQISRDSFTAESAPGRMVSVHVAPSVLYSLGDVLTDYVRVRPYVGAGARLSSSTLQAGGLTFESRKGRSWQVLGGAEVTSAIAPRLAMSLDLRYDSSRTPFSGVTFGGVGFSAAGHWYIK